jgi:hypothetical protein
MLASVILTVVDRDRASEGLLASGDEAIVHDVALECGGLPPLSPRELARAHLGLGRGSRPASSPVGKRQPVN